MASSGPGERFISLDGSRIRCLVQGEGETVLLWPGLGGTAEAFGRLLREGAARHLRMAAIDPPGHGLSGAFPLRSGDAAARVWLAALDQLGAKEAVIGGHSFGAVSTLAGLSSSEELRSRTRALLLYDGGYLTEREGQEERHAHCARHLEAFTFPSWDDFLATARQGARQWDLDSEKAAWATMAERGGRIVLRVGLGACQDASDLVASWPPQRLRALGVRALLLRAGQPPEMEEERADGVSALREKLPALTVQIVGDATHDILEDAPQEVSIATFAFLA